MSDWPEGEVDRFIADKLAAAELTPAPPADRLTLLRRAFFDMVGVPPTAAEVETFLSDDQPGAWARQVDRLIDDRRYGERWARHWLDLVRYADSDGYRADDVRPNAWRFRDYVIDSFNGDKPYDQFMAEQLAGDEMFPDDFDAQIATGYLQHGIYEWNSRDAVGQRDILIAEMTDVTGDVFLGLGMQCAKCHDHKFDPILQKDYFALRSFFEPVRLHTDQLIATEAQRHQHEVDMRAWVAATQDVRDRLAAAEAPYRELAQKNAVGRFPESIQALYWMPASERTADQQQLVDLVQRQVDYDYDRMERDFSPEDKVIISDLRKELDGFKNLKPADLPTARVVTDVSSDPPVTTIPKKRTEVTPDFLTILGDSPPEVAATPDSTGRRSALARWLGRDDNPLSTRVIVNRVWQYHFGEGLASNASDFGRLGEAPSHPELLDWMVQQFVENGWRLKPLHRMILTSATYRQAAVHPDAARQQRIDPTNRLRWRFDTRRLDAEQIRDSLLAVTAQLSKERGGPGSSASGERRSIYTQVRRNSRDPLLEVFDLPRFFTSTASRDRTTSPLQSLLLINSSQMLGHAEALNAGVEAQSAGAEPRDRAASLWQQVFSRPPTEQEVDMALQFIDVQSDAIAAEAAATEPVVASESVPTDAMPTRDGQALRVDPQEPPSLAAVDPRLAADNFTIEAYIVVDSVYSTAAVRSIASTHNGDKQQPGWTFGVTGKGSRRKPQTLVMHMFGKDADGEHRESAVFSDQHIDLDTPYYVAASVTTSADGNSSVRFILKDLSDDNVPIADVVHPHALAGGLSTDRLTLGCKGNGSAVFDGLIADVRYSDGPRGIANSLYQSDHVDAATVAYWSFGSGSGLDQSDNDLHLQSVASVIRRGDPRSAAWIDLAHVLLNSNEFLYVH